MATKTDRVHIKDPIDVNASYDEGEVELVFTSMTQYPNYKEVVVHFKVWFIVYVIDALKRATRKAREEIEQVEETLNSGV